MTTHMTDTQWFKSSRSSGKEACVEVAWLGKGRVGIRDSKNSTGPVLAFAASEWDLFIADLSC